MFITDAGRAVRGCSHTFGVAAGDHQAVARDGCIVDSAPIAGLISGFVDTWRRTRPATDTHYGALDWLASESGVPRHTLEKLVSRDRNGNLNPRRRTLELREADQLIVALDHQEAFHDGTLDVRPNPLAKKDAQMQCCAGSLNGAVKP